MPESRSRRAPRRSQSQSVPERRRQQRGGAASGSSSNAPASSSSAVSRRGRWRRFLTDPLICYYLFIAVVLLLTFLGVIMVFSSSTVDLLSDGESPYSQLIRQGAYAIVGIAAAVALSFVNARRFPKWAFWILVAAGLLQVLTLTHLGRDAGGNGGWLALGPIEFEPAEILKFSLCLWMPFAIAVGKKRSVEHDGKVSGGKSFAVALAVCFLSFIMVMMGGDLGTGVILLMICAAAVFVGGLDIKQFWGGIVVVAAMVILLFVARSSNRMRRIMAAYTGCDAKGAAEGVCYQVIHGQYALASGGFFGVGLGASREKWDYLPEARNDFIFAIIGEELGFVGAVVVILCFVLLGWCLINVALRMPDHPYERLVLVCVAAWTCGQAIVNILVVLQLLPVIGLPLPYISAGGTALISNLAASGVCVSMMRQQDDIKRVLGAAAWANAKKKKAKKQQRRRRTA